MVSSNHIIDVSESDFQFEVVNFSQHKPVVVDFWAEWCGPCRMLGPILEKLAEEADGHFRLAKVDVDENPNLAMRYNVRGIPAVKGFRLGEVVAEFAGAIPEPQIRNFIRELAPSPTDLTLMKAQNLLIDYQWENAEACFREVLRTMDEAPAALLGLAKCLIAQNEAEEAVGIFNRFPSSRELSAVETLTPLAAALASYDPLSEDDFNEAAYQRALHLIRLGNFAAAMDGLIDVLRRDKNYRSGLARKVMLGLFELMGEQSDLIRQYRAELASVLF